MTKMASWPQKVRSIASSSMPGWTIRIFTKPPPKTTGRELFGIQFARRVMTESHGMAMGDLIATATALTAKHRARITTSLRRTADRSGDHRRWWLDESDADADDRGQAAIGARHVARESLDQREERRRPSRWRSSRTTPLPDSTPTFPVPPVAGPPSSVRSAYDRTASVGPRVCGRIDPRADAHHDRRRPDRRDSRVRAGARRRHPHRGFDRSRLH